MWEACQCAQVVLLTANRSDEGPESLEATIQHYNTPDNTPVSLPVFTLANDQRVLRDRLYAEAVADRLLEFLFAIRISSALLVWGRRALVSAKVFRAQCVSAFQHALVYFIIVK